MHPGGAEPRDAEEGVEVAERQTWQATHTQPSAEHFPPPLVTHALGAGEGGATGGIDCAQPRAATAVGGTLQLPGQRAPRMGGGNALLRWPSPLLPPH